MQLHAPDTDKRQETLQKAIEHEILAKQPISAFGPSTSGILRENTSEYLQYRMIRLNGAHALAPSFLDQVRATHHVPGSHITLAASRQIICDAFSKSFQNVVGLLMSGAATFPLTMERRDLVAITAALGSVGDLRIARSLTLDLLWQSSNKFGMPLVIAVSANNVSIVRAILKDFERRSHTHPISCRLVQMALAIEEATRKHFSGVLAELVHFIDSYGAALPAPTLSQIVFQAYLTRSAKIIDIVTSIRSTNSSLPIRDAFYSACANPPDFDTISLILSLGHARVDTYDGSSMSPLRTAVDRQQVLVVKELLRLGSNPDGCPSLADHERPLWIAIQHNNLGVVQALLGAGADGRLVLAPYNDQDQIFRQQRAQIVVLVRNANRARNFYVDRPHVAAINIYPDAGDA
jgi:hypothetical protein